MGMKKVLAEKAHISHDIFGRATGRRNLREEQKNPDRKIPAACYGSDAHVSTRWILVKQIQLDTNIWSNVVIEDACKAAIWSVSSSRTLVWSTTSSTMGACYSIMHIFGRTSKFPCCTMSQVKPSGISETSRHFHPSWRQEQLWNGSRVKNKLTVCVKRKWMGPIFVSQIKIFHWDQKRPQRVSSVAVPKSWKVKEGGWWRYFVWTDFGTADSSQLFTSELAQRTS